MKTIKPGKNAIDLAVKVLSKGGLVIYPTETVYGIGAEATNPSAIRNLTNYKKRPFGKPYSIAVSGLPMAKNYAKINKAAEIVYKKFLPGPVTVISKGKHKVAAGVESETGTLGIRIPDYKIVVDIVKALGKPITATSANASYQKRPYKIADIFDCLSQKQKKLIDLIIDAGKLPKREPSTVIDTTMEEPAILRQGDISLKDENKILSRSEENTQNFAKELFQKYQDYLGKRPLIFALQGSMGAGKTQFTKGLGLAIGIGKTIVSPTYNLLNSYTSPVTGTELGHFDAWRIEKPKEFLALGLMKMIENKNMVISIEWAERVATVIKNYREQATIIWVKIEVGKDENERLISWGAI